MKYQIEVHFHRNSEKGVIDGITTEGDTPEELLANAIIWGPHEFGVKALGALLDFAPETQEFLAYRIMLEYASLLATTLH